MTETTCHVPGCKAKVIAICLEIAANGDVAELAFCQGHIRDLGADYLLPNLMEVRIQPSEVTYEVCELHKVLFLYEPQQYLIVLKNMNTRSVFVMQTGYVEACSVYGATKTSTHPAPLTYQLIANLVGALEGSVVEAIFDGYSKEFQAYESHLVIGRRSGKVKVRCRGSDAVGISFRNRSLAVE